MEPTSATINHHSTTVAAAAGVGIRWSSPVPYLLGGMGIVLGLIAMALIILACTHDKHSDDKEKDAAGIGSNVVDDGQKFVVIMAGAHKPTFLAKPMPMPEPKPTDPNAIPATSVRNSPTGDEQV